MCMCVGLNARTGVEQQNQPQLHVALSVLGQGHLRPSHPGQPPALQVSPQCWPELLRLVQT